MNKATKILIATTGLILFSRMRSAAGSPSAPADAPADVDYRNTTRPSGMRLNNPGNLKFFNLGWLGEVGSAPLGTGIFSVFSQYKYGIRAMLKDLQNDYRNKQKKTLRALINEYAPGSENPTSSYIAFVASRTGINPDANFPDTYANWKKIVQAMTRFETGIDAVTGAQFDQVWTEFGF